MDPHELSRAVRAWRAARHAGDDPADAFIAAAATCDLPCNQALGFRLGDEVDHRVALGDSPADSLADGLTELAGRLTGWTDLGPAPTEYDPFAVAADWS